MIKYILFIISLILISCSSTKNNTLTTNYNKNSLINDINESIIDGFYDGDTTNKSNVILYN